MLWINGTLHKGTIASFDLRDRGLLLGDGIFETIAVFNYIPFQLEAHLIRLEQGGYKLGLPINRNCINEAITTVITQSSISDGILRITVTRGSGDRGLLPPSTSTLTIIASIVPWTPLNNQPITLIRSSIKRNENSPISQIKSLCYLEQIMVLQEAVNAGYDDAVMLNTNNKVACASSANIICVYGNKFVTPRVCDGILPGIMRNLVFQDARSLGFETDEVSITWDELLAADAVFLTNSVKLVRHVKSINLRQWPNTANNVTNMIRNKLIERIVIECGTNPSNFI